MTIAPPGRRPMTFRPVVLTATSRRELRWRRRLLMPGLFDREYAFQLELLPTLQRSVHRLEALTRGVEQAAAHKADQQAGEALGVVQSIAEEG
jgi:hypothetical protein